MSVWRSRWSAIGAAVAVTLGAGGLGLAQAAIDTGDKPVTVTIAPQRILDTRSNLGLQGRFLNESPRDLQVTGDVPVASGGTATVVPTDAVAVVVNVTVVLPDSNGHLSLRPSGATGIPTTATVNFLPGAVEPNAATVDLGPGGRVQIFIKTAATNGTADVVVDVVGYTVDHTHDDRYYKKAQVDGLVGAVITGHVEGDAIFELGQHSTPSMSYVNVPFASTTVATQANGRLLVNFSAQSLCIDNGSAPHTSWCMLRVLVDGSPIEPDRVVWAKGDPDGNDWFSRSHQFVSPPLAAGSHTVQAQYKVDESTGVFNLDQIVLSALPLAP